MEHSPGPSSTSRDKVTILSVTVTPQDGPAGTTRTLTVKAVSSRGRRLTAIVNAVSGMPFHSQPALPGVFVWTFRY